MLPNPVGLCQRQANAPIFTPSANAVPEAARTRISFLELQSPGQAVHEQEAICKAVADAARTAVHVPWCLNALCHSLTCQGSCDRHISAASTPGAAARDM